MIIEVEMLSCINADKWHVKFLKLLKKKFSSNHHIKFYSIEQSNNIKIKCMIIKIS